MTFDIVSHVQAVFFCQGKYVSAVQISHGVYKKGYISGNKNKTILCFFLYPTKRIPCIVSRLSTWAA